MTAEISGRNKICNRTLQHCTQKASPMTLDRIEEAF